MPNSEGEAIGETEEDRRLWREPLFTIHFPCGNVVILRGDGRCDGLPPGVVVNNRYPEVIRPLLERLESAGLARHT